VFFEGMSLLSQNKDFITAEKCGCAKCSQLAEEIYQNFQHRCELMAMDVLSRYSLHKWTVRIRRKKQVRELVLCEGNPSRWHYLGRTVTTGQATRMLAEAFGEGTGVISRGSRQLVVKA
jgi:hypothetical protein